MKKYTTREAYELAKERPYLVFVDRKGDIFVFSQLAKRLNAGKKYLSKVEPYTAHQLIPFDVDITLSVEDV